MGKQSTRENKNKKIEYGTQSPTPYDVIQMADCYKRPDLCNYFTNYTDLKSQLLKSLNKNVLFQISNIHFLPNMIRYI